MTPIFSPSSSPLPASSSEASLHTPTAVPNLFDEFVQRISVYLSAQGNLLPLPIGECLVAGVGCRSAQRSSSLGTFSLLSSSPPDGGPLPLSTNPHGKSSYLLFNRYYTPLNYSGLLLLLHI